MAWMVAGNTGVTLFFVLSGFLLSIPWLQHLVGQRESMPSIASFYRARALRILPLYYAWLVFSAVMTGNVGDAARAGAFLFVGFDLFPYSVVWWTLSTEVQFYLAMPLFFWAWQHGRWGRAAVLLAFATWLLAYCYWAFTVAPGSEMVGWLASKSLFGRLPAFAIGIALAWWYITRASTQPLTQYRLPAALATAIVLSLLGLVLERGAEIGDLRAESVWHIRHTLEASLWACLIALLLSTRPVGWRTVINTAMATLGKLSYSLYLNHVAVLFFVIYPVRESMGAEAFRESYLSIVLPLVAIALATLLAWATYRLIELPFLTLKTRGRAA